MQQLHMCFSCSFWHELLGNPKSIIIDGAHYIDEGRVPGNQSQFVGYGGREFLIKMNDGRVISTNNLWNQGTIPKSWRNDFPNNAEFLPEEYA